MKLILKDNVAGLGFKDDVVEVKDGYGRNYLIPRGLAVVATKDALKQHAEVLRQRAHKLEAIKAKAQEKADQLKEKKLNIPMKVSESGTVYGGVNAALIAELLGKEGVEVDRKIIEIKAPVKVVGEYVAHVYLHKDITVEVPFVVVDEDAPAVVEVIEEVVVAEAPEAPAEEEPKAE
ncbi:MAG: 50S ribosomal protein L9 [Muribaculaceae bacterium]|nr:50S ribosomal protein L9 [Muribaculaceae bacterium]